MSFQELVSGVSAFQIKFEFGTVDCCGRRKTAEAGEKPLEQGQEPTKKLTHIWN